MNSSREVVPIAFKRQGMIHLDIKFNIVGESTALIARDDFQPETVRWLERHFDLVEMTSEESRKLELNTLSIGNHQVIVGKHSARLPDLLHRKGFTPIPTDYLEVISWPGSFRCTRAKRTGTAASTKANLQAVQRVLTEQFAHLPSNDKCKIALGQKVNHSLQIDKLHSFANSRCDAGWIVQRRPTGLPGSRSRNFCPRRETHNYL